MRKRVFPTLSFRRSNARVAALDLVDEWLFEFHAWSRQCSSCSSTRCGRSDLIDEVRTIRRADATDP